MYIAIGVVALYAAGAAPLAFAIAAIAYIMTGLAYAELASTYPYAGGAQVYSMKSFNDLVGFVAGWSLLFSYTVDIALFSIASVGYLSFFVPELNRTVLLGPFQLSMTSLVALILVLFLVVINLVGIRESSALNESLIIPSILVKATMLVIGFLLAFKLWLFLGQLSNPGNPAPLNVEYVLPTSIKIQNFIYGITIAMMSFIGIESIAQAAEETRRPYKWIPKATKMSVLAVIVFVIGFSVLATGMMDWRTLVQHTDRPLVEIAREMPYVSYVLTPLVSFVGFIITLASANTGVVGVSRVVFSMGKFRLLPTWFHSVHHRYRTPTRTILVFGITGALMTLIGGIEQIAGMYAFGALLSYVIVNLALIKLRNEEREVYRPWKAPGNIRIGDKELPVVGLIGASIVFVMWILVVLMNWEARVYGSLWVLLGVALYVTYRKKIGLPVMAALGKGMVAPGSYMIRSLVIVPTDEPIDAVEEALSRLDKRFSLRLVVPVITRGLDMEEIDSLREYYRREVEILESSLRRKGYEVSSTIVLLPDISDLDERIPVKDYDHIIIMVRKKRHDLSGRRLPERLSERYPGMVIMLSL